jgi:hypothetical protein
LSRRGNLQKRFSAVAHRLPRIQRRRRQFDWLFLIYSCANHQDLKPDRLTIKPSARHRNGIELDWCNIGTVFFPEGSDGCSDFISDDFRALIPMHSRHAWFSLFCVRFEMILFDV